MALGGGTFITQNKTLPGAYINFVSAEKATSVFADRGYCAFAMKLSWGEANKVITVESGDFISNSMKLFGFSYDEEKLRPLREIFLNASTLYLYRIGVGEKASSDIGSAKYAGSRGNDITVTVTASTDDGFIVLTKLGDTVVDEQVVTTGTDLVSNDYVDFNEGVNITAQVYTFSGGTDTEPTGNDYQKALTALESYTFNALGCDSENDTIKALFAAYTKRMRDDVGVKFQTVLYDYAKADYEGVISVKNSSDAVYWVSGAQAGCAVNKSLTNTKYDGEYEIEADYSQSELEEFIKSGEFVFHRVNDEIRVLEDINTFVSVTKDKTEDFSYNQTIRVIDQIAMDIATIFNTYYLGKVPNDTAGRISLWNDIVKHHKTLQDLRAIEGFESEDVTVEQGDTKKSVVVTDYVTVTNAMEQLYMTVVVS